MSRLAWRQFLFSLVALVAPCVEPRAEQAHGAARTWIGGNSDWVDGGSTANWNPADEPDADDEAIFNTSNAVNLASNNALNGLTLSSGVELKTNNFDLLVDGLAQLTGVSTNLFVGGTASQLNADNLTVDSQATLELTGGTVIIDEELVNGLLAIKAGGTTTGHGTVILADTPSSPTTLLDNNGTLAALSRPTVITDPPPAGTLTINGGNASARIDLDGSAETGFVSVNRNQKLDINVTLADDFNGNLDLFQGSTLDIAGAWTFASGTIDADNGAQMGSPSFPAGTSIVAGGKLTQSGGTITVIDNDGALQFDAAYQMDGGTLTSNGRVVVNSTFTQKGGIINFVNGTTTAVKVSGSDATFNGTVNVTGDVQFDARVAIGGTVNINTGGEPLQLNGGDNATAPNTIAGGTINGPG